MHGRWITASAMVLLVTIASAAQKSDERAALAERVRTLTRDAAWIQVAAVPIAFRTHHPQGMVKIGDALFVSSVEIRVRTRRFEKPVDGFDRDTGEGAGHLFKMDASGKLLGHVTIGEATMYHPGGIDYDGRHIWVSVAEYRPAGKSIVYRVDPTTMKAVEVFRFGDHLGALVRNTDDNTLHGVSWGSRRFYRWTLDAEGRVTNAADPGELRTVNPSHYVDYQDCKYAGSRRMLCTGVTEMPHVSGTFRLGGIELVNLEDGRPEHQVPVLRWTNGGLAMTQNPVWLEAVADGVRAYFMPEDDTSTLYIFEARSALR